MRRVSAMLSLSACAIAFGVAPAWSQGAPAVTLTRLDCGTPGAPTDVAARMSDTYAYNGLKVQLTFSCYLVSHPNGHLLWDAGNAMSAAPTTPKTSLVDLLAQLKIAPEQITYVGISHHHGDHTGQAGSFPKATLLIGRGDWEVLTSPNRPANMSVTQFTPWMSGGGKVEALTGDLDVFGDGSVVVLNMPGHTPGHRSLLVRLKEMGPVLITGDLAHFRENYETNGVPTFNTDRAATLASLDRFKKIATNLKATVIIQHDMRDVGKLPAFPAAAK